MSSHPTPLPLLPLLLLLLCTLSLYHVSSQQVNPPGKITCYDFDGRPFYNNSQCPGSRACCADASICLPDRMCQQGLQLVRSPCSLKLWDGSCSQLCQYGTKTGFLPRIVKCKDGSYCCDNDPPCCSNSRGVVLDGVGGIVSTESPKPSTTSTSKTSTSPSSSLSSTSHPPEALNTPLPPLTSTTNTPPPSSSSSSSNPKIIGPIIGSVTGVSIIAALAFFLWHRRRKISKNNNNLRSESQSQTFLRRYELNASSEQQQPAELVAVDNKRITQIHKAELPAEAVAVENRPQAELPANT